MRTAVIAAIALLAGSGAYAMDAVYATPQDALDALAAALETGDPISVANALGPDAQDLTGAAEDQIDEDALATLYAAWRAGYRFVPEADGSLTIELGEDDWPFPVPLIREASAWRFDIEAGRAEIAAREIGRNELDTLDTIDAYLDIQWQYRLSDPDGDGVMEFASSLLSPPGARTGLYWIGPDSPVGDRAARASLDGFLETGASGPMHEPLSGYYFRILTGQTDAAPGGAMSYVINGNMVASHALLAVPAEYGVSGISTFLVNEAGMIWEADLGAQTLDVAYDMELLDPDPDMGWTILADQPDG